MATHPSILGWEILWTEEAGGLQSMGPQRVGRDLVTKQQQLSALTFHPTPVINLLQGNAVLSPRSVLTSPHSFSYGQTAL